jgi:hypothetical protein
LLCASAFQIANELLGSPRFVREVVLRPTALLPDTL